MINVDNVILFVEFNFFLNFDMIIFKIFSFLSNLLNFKLKIIMVIELSMLLILLWFNNLLINLILD